MPEVIAALLLAAAVAAPSPAPTLPPSMWAVRISSGPAVPRFLEPAHLPHDFATLSALVAVADGRAPVSAISTPEPSPAGVYLDRSADAIAAPMGCEMAAEARYGPQAFGTLGRARSDGGFVCVEVAPFASPAPSPTPKTIAHVTAAENPCAHRIFCGRFELWPRTAAGRANAYSALADLVVTVVHTHGDPNLEGDPLVRPFIRGGVPTLALGWALQIAARHAIFRNAPAVNDAIDSFEFAQHVAGVASWLSPASYPYALPASWVRDVLHEPAAEALWVRYDTCPRTVPCK